MDLSLSVKKYIRDNELIADGDTVLLGLSGGGDSVCLMHILSGLRGSLGFSLHVMHVHHGIRGEEADRDLSFSRELAAELSVPFHECHVDAPAFASERGMGLEEAARLLRYEALRGMLDKLPGDGEKRIAVAHHRDDQAETVLHNLIRGSGLRGIRGMEPKRDELIRPLLFAGQEEILSFLRKKEISYIVDSSNMDIQYTRNKLRTVVLPELKSINPRAVEHIAHTAGILAQAEELFSMQARSFVSEKAEITDETEGDGVLKELRLPLGELREQNGLIQSYILTECIERLGTPKKDWEAVHLKDISALIYKAGGSHLDLPYRMSADIIKKELVLRVNREYISMKRRKK